VSSSRTRLTAYAIAATVARSGNGAVATAIVLSVLVVGGSAQEGSVIVSCLTATAAVAGPVMGVRLERAHRPRLAIAVALGGLAIGCGALALGIGSWPLIALAVIAGLTGLAYPSVTGVLSSQLRPLVPGVAPSRLYAVDVGTYNVSEVAGPALVGSAVIFDSTVPGAIAMEIVTVLFAVSAILVGMLPLPDRDQSADASAPTPLRLVLKAGITTFARSRALLFVTVTNTVNFAATAALVIGGPMMGLELGSSAGLGGIFLAVISAGAVVGSLVFLRRPLRAEPQRIFTVVAAVYAVSIGALALAPTLLSVMVVAFIAGVIQAPMNIAVFTTRDRESSEETRAFVFVTASSLKTASFAVGSLFVAGLVGLGWRGLFAVAALWQVLALGVGWIVVSRMPRPNGNG
jgi:MFS family permease